MTVTDQTIEILNELLRGELAAVETYAQAIEKFGRSPGHDFLQLLAGDHEESVDQLSEFITDVGGEPAETSGLWGGFVKALAGSANLLGESPALKVLQEGEEHGIKEYQEALDDPDISDDSKDLIREELLPRLTDHVVELQRIRDRKAKK